MRDIDIGLSFNGIHTSSMGLDLVNRDESMRALNDGFNIQTDSVDGYDGEYYLGSKAKPREFEIKLYMEDATMGDMERVARWFGRDAAGELVFDMQPWKGYWVRVTEPITPLEYPRYDSRRKMFLYSGTMSVTLTAFQPFGFLLESVIQEYPNVGSGKEALDGATAILPEEIRPVKMFTSLTDGQEILLINQGTAPAPLSIRAIGLNGTLTFTHRESGQSLSITGDGGEYLLDAEHGRMVEILDGEEKMAGSGHSGSYIQLRPGAPMLRELQVAVNGNAMTLTGGALPEIQAGDSVYVGGKWTEIQGVNGGTLTLKDAISVSDGVAQIVKGNHIVVTEDVDSVRKVEFIWKDRMY